MKNENYSNNVLKAYQKVINDIDDFFESQYLHYSASEIRDFIDDKFDILRDKLGNYNDSEN